MTSMNVEWAKGLVFGCLSCEIHLIYSNSSENVRDPEFINGNFQPK